jgi:hypothetical protein
MPAQVVNDKGDYHSQISGRDARDTDWPSANPVCLPRVVAVAGDSGGREGVPELGNRAAGRSMTLCSQAPSIERHWND